MKEAVIVHLWEGYPEYCWYPKTKQELEEMGFVVYVPQMPEPNFPKQDIWVPTLREKVKEPSENTYLVGHSIGAVTIMRYLEGLSDQQEVGGVVLVAGFTDDMGYEVFSNFFTKPLNFEEIKGKARNFTVIVSDDDPYINMKYGYKLRDKLNGELIIKAGLKHMSLGCNALPDVTDAIRRQIERSQYGFRNS